MLSICFNFSEKNQVLEFCMLVMLCFREKIYTRRRQCQGTDSQATGYSKFIMKIECDLIRVKVKQSSHFESLLFAFF